MQSEVQVVLCPYLWKKLFLSVYKYFYREHLWQGFIFCLGNCQFLCIYCLWPYFISLSAFIYFIVKKSDSIGRLNSWECVILEMSLWTSEIKSWRRWRFARTDIARNGSICRLFIKVCYILNLSCIPQKTDIFKKENVECFNSSGFLQNKNSFWTVILGIFKKIFLRGLTSFRQKL